MREILFRGKRIDNGKWVEGYLYRLSEKLNPFILLKSEKGASYEVETKTVGQYTGMKDKNDNKIFEGDILKIKSYVYDYEYITQVYYSYHTLCVDIYDQNYSSTTIGFADDIWNGDFCEIEVIGNIYDNPKLMKGVK